MVIERRRRGRGEEEEQQTGVMEGVDGGPPPLAARGGLSAARADPVGADEREHRRGARREQEARKRARARHLCDGQAAREHAVERRDQAPEVVVAERARHQRVQPPRTQVVHAAREVPLHKVQHPVPCSSITPCKAQVKKEGMEEGKQRRKENTNREQSEWGSRTTRTRRRPSTRRKAPHWPAPRSTRPRRGSAAAQPRAQRSRAPGSRCAHACCRSSAVPQSSPAPARAGRRSARSSTRAEDLGRPAAHTPSATRTPRPSLCTATASRCVSQSVTQKKGKERKDARPITLARSCGFFSFLFYSSFSTERTNDLRCCCCCVFFFRLSHTLEQTKTNGLR